MGSLPNEDLLTAKRALKSSTNHTSKRKSGYQPREPSRVSANMRRIRREGSAIERKLGSAMWKAGLRYRKQYPIEGKPDFAFPKAKVAVFCDSHFWHGYRWKEQGKSELRKNREFWVAKIERNMQRDQEINRLLRDQGWTVLRFWEHEIYGNSEACVKSVAKALSESMPLCQLRISAQPL